MISKTEKAVLIVLLRVREEFDKGARGFHALERDKIAETIGVPTSAIIDACAALERRGLITDNADQAYFYSITESGKVLAQR